MKKIIALILAIVLVFSIWVTIATSNGNNQKRIDNLNIRIDRELEINRDLRDKINGYLDQLDDADSCELKIQVMCESDNNQWELYNDICKTYKENNN